MSRDEKHERRKQEESKGKTQATQHNVPVSERTNPYARLPSRRDHVKKEQIAKNDKGTWQNDEVTKAVRKGGKKTGRLGDEGSKEKGRRSKNKKRGRTIAKGEEENRGVGRQKQGQRKTGERERKIKEALERNSAKI